MLLDDLIRYFGENHPLEFDKFGDPSDEALKVATATLLWEACLADDNLSEVEINRICELMEREFNISEAETQAILAICGQGADREKISELVSLINEHFATDQREEIVKMASAIVQADNELELSEAVVCDVLHKRLKLPG